MGRWKIHLDSRKKLEERNLKQLNWIKKHKRMMGIWQIPGAAAWAQSAIMQFGNSANRYPIFIIWVVTTHLLEKVNFFILRGEKVLTNSCLSLADGKELNRVLALKVVWPGPKSCLLGNFGCATSKCTSYLDNGKPRSCLIYNQSKCDVPGVVITCEVLVSSPRCLTNLDLQILINSF